MEASWRCWTAIVSDVIRIRCHSDQMSFKKKRHVQTPCWLAELVGVGQEGFQAQVCVYASLSILIDKRLTVHYL
jgi:hypothetical protein